MCGLHSSTSVFFEHNLNYCILSCSYGSPRLFVQAFIIPFYKRSILFVLGIHQREARMPRRTRMDDPCLTRGSNHTSDRALCNYRGWSSCSVGVHNKTCTSCNRETWKLFHVVWRRSIYSSCKISHLTLRLLLYWLEHLDSKQILNRLLSGECRK